MLKQALSIKSRVSSAFSLTDVGGLQLWLQYNKGQGTITDGIQWDDQSGNNRHASQTTDAQEGSGFSGGAFVTDAGSQDNLDFASTFSEAGDYHVFMVMDLSEESNETFISSVDNSSFMRFAQGGSATEFRMKHGGTTLNFTLSSGFELDKAIAEVTRDGSNDVRVARNGASLGTATGTGTFDFEQIGSSSNSLSSASVFEVVVYDKILTGSDLTKVRNDIADRNGISI